MKNNTLLIVGCLAAFVLLGGGLVYLLLGDSAGERSGASSASAGREAAAVLTAQPDALHGAADARTQGNLGQPNTAADAAGGAGADSSRAPLAAGGTGPAGKSETAPVRRGKLAVGLPKALLSACTLPRSLPVMMRSAMQEGLVRSGKYEVVEIASAESAALDAELARATSNEITGGAAAQLGKMAAIKYLPFVTVTGFSITTKPSALSGGGTILSASMQVSLKLVDTSTHRVIEQRSVNALQEEILPQGLAFIPFENRVKAEYVADTVFLQNSSAAAAASGGSAAAASASSSAALTRESATVEVSSSLAESFSAKILNALAAKAATQVLGSINERLFPMKVIALQDGLPVVNAGQDHALRKGDYLQLLQVTKASDPDTGEMLSVEKPLGVLRVKSLADKTAVCDIIRGLSVSEGMVVRKISEQALREISAEAPNATPASAPTSTITKNGEVKLRPIQKKEIPDW